MKAIRKMLTVTGYFVVALSFMCGFVIGAIFGETVINKAEKPTALTYFLAGEIN